MLADLPFPQRRLSSLSWEDSCMVALWQALHAVDSYVARGRTQPCGNLSGKT